MRIAYRPALVLMLLGLVARVMLLALAALTTALVSSAHAATLPPAGRFEPFGLEGRVVTSLGLYGSLYAGTIGDGVHRRDLAASHAPWIALGLEGKRIRAVYPHASGPLGFATTAGVEDNPSYPDSALVYCSEMDQVPWVASDSGMTRASINAIWSLDGFPSPAICGETFASSIGSAGGVWRRGFRSAVWEHVLDIGFGVGNVVRVDASSGNVWAGGETSIFSPWIARSVDRGDTWQTAYPDLAGDNACDAIAIHPADPDVAYAGMEGRVIKTSDGGATWDDTGLVGAPAYMYGLALDSADPFHLLAGGMIAAPNDWALWESFDGGDTWDVIPPPELSTSEDVTGISTIVADPARPGVFYIATLGHGVWKYLRPTTGVEDPPGVDGPVLEPNVPNPFHPRTTLSFFIPASHDRSRVRLAIFDARGALVRVLIDGERTAGRHQAVWNGEDAHGRLMAPGVYYSRLSVGSFQRTRQIHLVR